MTYDRHTQAITIAERPRQLSVDKNSIDAIPFGANSAQMGDVRPCPPRKERTNVIRHRRITQKARKIV